MIYRWGCAVQTTDPQILAAMSRRDFYPHPASAVTHIQTHISHVFLTGSLAYKLKKPLDLGFLDFATLDDRKRICLDELQLNRRLAPDIYLAVLGIFRHDGGLVLDELDSPRGELVEVCVQMKEMDQARMLDRLLETGQVREEHIRAIARRLAAFYGAERSTPEIAAFGSVAQIRNNVAENFEQTKVHQGLAVAPARWRAVRDWSLEFIERRQDVFRNRVSEGRIIDGHGDLHAANINLEASGAVHIFDCIEFNRRFRYQDPACDLAFLAMELEFHGRPDLAALLVREAATALGDTGLLDLMDFYKCYRAVVRAKVNAFMLSDQDIEPGQRRHDLELARSYWRLAASYLPAEPSYFLVCFMGLMGTGKSYRARMLAGATGWDLLQSDHVRKELAGLQAGERGHEEYEQGLYAPEATQATYHALAERAAAHLAQGLSVIVDASFKDRDRRESFVALAREHGAGVLMVEVRTAREVVMQRLAKREEEEVAASDGRVALMDAQAAQWQDTEELRRAGLVLQMDGGLEADGNMDELLQRLKEMGWDQE